MYKSALETSANAAGTLNEQQDIFMESTTAHLQQMRTAAEGVYDSLLDAGTINTFVDGLTKALEITEQLVNGFGGLEGIIATLAPLILNTFSTQIADNAVRVFENFNVKKENEQLIQSTYGQLMNVATEYKDNPMAKTLTDKKQQALDLSSGLTLEEIEQITKAAEMYGEVMVETSTAEENRREEIDAEIRELKKLGITLNETGKDTEAYKNKVKELSQIQESLTDMAQERETFGELGLSGDEDGLLKLTDLVNGYKQLSNDYENQEYDKLSDKMKSKLLTLTTDFESAMQSGTADEVEAVVKQYKELIRTMSTPIDTDAVSSSIQDTLQVSENIINNNEALQKSAEEAFAAARELATNRSIVTGFINIGSAIGAGVNSVRSFKEAFSSLGDSTVPLTEKLSAFIPAIMSTQTSITALSKATDIFNNSKIRNILLTKAQTIANMELSPTILAVAVKTKLQTASQALLNKELLVTLGYFSAFVLAAASVAFAIYSVNKALNSASDNLKESQEQSKTLSDNAKAAAQELQNIDSALLSLENHKTELQRMTQGTEEWRNKLAEVHSEVEKLIEDYPELRQYAEWKNGGWDIDLEKVEEVKQKRQYSARESTAIASLSRADVSWQTAMLAANTASKDDGEWNIGWAPFGYQNPLGNSWNLKAEDQLYSDAIKTELEIQENINEAKKEQNIADERYWTAILDYHNALLQKEKEELIAMQQIVDTVKGDEVKKYFSKANGEQSSADILNEQYSNYLLSQKASGIYGAAQYHFEQEQTFLGNSEQETLIQQYLRQYWSNMTGLPIEQIEVSGNNYKGYKVKFIDPTSHESKTEKISVTQASSIAAGLYTEEQLNKEDTRDLYSYVEGLSDNEKIITLFNEGIVSMSELTLEQIKLIDSLNSSEIISSLSKNISSKTGQSLLEDMMSLDETKDYTLEQWDEIAQAIQEVYLQKGPEALELFKEKLRNNKVTVSDFMNFDFDNDVKGLSTEILERLKALKVDEKDLNRYKIKLNIEGELDDEIANKILNYIEAEKELNKIYKDRENIFKSLNSQDYTSTGFIDNLKLVSDSINTYFGTDIDDKFILSHLDTIEDFVNGVEGSANRLREMLSSKSNNTEQIDNIKKALLDINVEPGQKVDQEVIDSIRGQLEEAGLNSKLLDKIMSNLGYEKTGKTYKKKLPISFEPDVIKKSFPRVEYTRNELEKNMSKLGFNEDEIYAYNMAVDTVLRPKNADDNINVEKEISEILADFAEKHGFGYDGQNFYKETTLTLKPEVLVDTEDKQSIKYDRSLTDEEIAKSLHYNSVEEAKNDGWTIQRTSSGPTFAIKVTEQIDKETVINNNLTDTFSFTKGETEKEIAQTLGDYNNFEEARKAGWIITNVPEYGIVAHFVVQKNIDEETNINNESDFQPNSDNVQDTEVKYTKKVEWDTQETKYDYNAEAQKDIDRRLSELKEEFDKTTGEARNAIYEEEINLLEQKNGLLQESIDLKKQEIVEDQKDLDEIAKKYGVNIEYDEMGRVTQESAQALMDAINGAGKAAADAQYSAQKAVDEADKDSKTRAQKTRAKNALTQASENVADIKKDSQVVEKLFSELASDSNTIADATSKIKKNTEEVAQLEISKQWNETDSEIKKSTKDIEHINKVIANLDKESSHLDFEGRMENAREAWELQKQKAKEYKKQTEDIYETINKVLSPEQIKKSGINFADLLNMDPLEIEKMSMDVDEILEGLYSKPLEERTDADKEEIAAWESIKEHLNDASKAAEGYNEILDKTKVNTDKVKEATDQIGTSKIDHNITKLNRELKTLKRAQSDLKGTALINNLKQQLAVQQKIVQEETKKLAIMKKQMVANATALQQEKDWAKIGLQIQYNEDGSIANYYELLAAIRSCKDLDEKRREELEGQLEVINKQSDAYAKQYEAIQSAKDAAEDIAKEIKDKLKEELSKAFNAKVDVEVNIEDAWRNLHKLRAELDGLKDDDYFGNMNLQLKQLTEYLNTNPNSTLPGGSTQILTQHLQDIMSEIRTMQGGGTSKIYGTDQSAAFSDLQNYRDQLGSNVQSMMDSVKEMKQTYLSAIDAMISANDKFIQSIDKMSSILNNTMNIIKLVYGDDSYQKMDKYLRMQAQLAMNSATAARNNADNYRARMLSSTTEEEYRKWADAWTGAIDSVYSHAESAIKALSELAENNFKKIAASLTDQWKEIGENGLPLSISWEYEKTKVKDFYDYTNSMYQKDSLSRKIQKAIDEATDPTTINALQDAYANIIGYLDESIKKNKQLSKYEIERANKLYELTLKQMALEDERDNKTKMRLRRDQAGNYRYEYVADDNKVAQSEEDVEKAKNDLYNLAYNRAVSASDSINTYTEQMTKQLSEAAKMYNGDPEQLQAEFKKIYNKYNGLIKAAQNDIALSEQDLKKYGLENDSDFLNVLDHTQNFKSGLTEEQLDQIFGENVNYYEMMRALGVDTEQMAESDMATAQDISKYYQYYADKLADQVDQTKLIVDQLEAMEPMLKSLAETALATYQQSLYFREQDAAAIGADSTDENGSSGLNLVVSNRATAGGTLTYDYDPDSGRVFMRNEDRHNEAGRKKLEAMYGAENVRTDAEWSEYARENQVTIGGFTRQKRTDSYNESRNKNGVVESSAALAEAEAIKSANKRKEIYDKTVKIATETAKKGGATAGIFQELQGIGAILAEPQPLEQHVQIDAQFQGKTKETEIFEALKGLVNRAAQVAENNGK